MCHPFNYCNLLGKSMVGKWEIVFLAVDCTDFVLSIGCDTVFLLRKHYCIVVVKSSALRISLCVLRREIENLRKKWYTE